MKTRIAFFVLALLALILLVMPVSAARPIRGTTIRVSIASDGTEANDGSGLYGSPSISADGRYIVFSSLATNLVAQDTNSAFDIFVHDTESSVTELVSVASDGSQGNQYSSGPSISADGRYVAFDSWASNLVLGDTSGAADVFIHDRLLRTTERVSLASGGTQGNGDSYGPSLSADGRYVAFTSVASNLVPGDTTGIWTFSSMTVGQE
jgi:Tol biopolymer transport system component